MVRKQNTGGGEEQDESYMEMTVRAWREITEELKDMRGLINKLQNELSAAQEEIKNLKTGSPQTVAQGTNPQVPGDAAMAGTPTMGATFAEMLKSPGAMSTVKEVVMKAVTSQEAARCTSQLLERKRAVVVTGVKEQEGSTREEWRSKDKAAVAGILKEIGMEGAVTDIEKFFRIGQYNKDKDRLIKVVLKNECTKEDILVKKSKLKYVTNYRQVFLQRDMTREEIIQAADARKRRRLREGSQGTSTPNPAIPGGSGEPQSSNSGTPEGTATSQLTTL